MLRGYWLLLLTLLVCFHEYSQAFLASHARISDGKTAIKCKETSATEQDEAKMVLASKLKSQAEQLRAEAQSIREAVEKSKEEKAKKEITKIEEWIEHLLVKQNVDETTDLLCSVEEVTELLMDGRFSQEQVNKIFNRICETGPPQSRSNCSPILALLVDAAGRLDCIERDENENKRWSGRVERDLRKRLFAMDWGIDLEAEKDD